MDPPVRTIMVTLDDIPSGVGVDKQEDIKYYIMDATENLGVTHVLLVGAGVEGEELFPVRKAWVDSPFEDYFPSDLYYADLYNDTSGFSNWDLDGDGKYAEYPADFPNVDVIPDVYLGRLPCNNVDEVNVVVDKIIEYKAHNKMTKKILQCGGDTYPGDPGGFYEGEYINSVVLSKLPGYSTNQLWASKGNLTKPNIAKGFKRCVDFVDFSGHGSVSGDRFATHPPDDESVWIPLGTEESPEYGFLYSDFDIYSINNGYKLPVCVYGANHINKYTESPNCLGAKTLNKNNGGGIAVFAPSCIYYLYFIDMIERYSGWIHVRTFEELISTKVLGEVWANVITDYYYAFESGLNKQDFTTLLGWSFFGDPTLVIQDGDDPKGQPVKISVYNGLLEKFLDQFPILQRLFQRLGL